MQLLTGSSHPTSPKRSEASRSTSNCHLRSVFVPMSATTTPSSSSRFYLPAGSETNTAHMQKPNLLYLPILISPTCSLSHPIPSHLFPVLKTRLAPKLPPGHPSAEHVSPPLIIPAHPSAIPSLIFLSWTKLFDRLFFSPGPTQLLHQKEVG